jgi:hypothetical protein
LFCELKLWICYASEGSSIFCKKYGTLFAKFLTIILSFYCHNSKKCLTWWVMLKWSDTFRPTNRLKKFVSNIVVYSDFFLVKIFKTFRNYLIENYHVQVWGYTWVETWHILECMLKKCKQILQAYSRCVLIIQLKLGSLLYLWKNVKTTLVYSWMCIAGIDHNIHIDVPV